jgi:hypothetical protein
MVLDERGYWYGGETQVKRPLTNLSTSGAPVAVKLNVLMPRGAEGSVGYGVVHDAVPGSVPPPAHEGQSIVYMVLVKQGYWYGGGGTQVSRRVNQSGNQWYLVKQSKPMLHM